VRAYSVGYKPSRIGKFLLVIVDFVRGMTRPGLTLYLIWEVHKTRAEIEAILAEAGVSGISIGEAIGVYTLVVETILFLVTTAVTWWFGTRTKKWKE
jgi:hypothetical protein